MLVPILAIAAVLIGGWILALLIEAWTYSTDTESKSKRRFPGFNQRFSLWSFVLLLFAPSSVKSSSTSHHQESDSVQSRPYDEEFCNSVS